VPALSAPVRFDPALARPRRTRPRRTRLSRVTGPHLREPPGTTSHEPPTTRRLRA
jgi:hypothetical protein